MKKVDSGSYHSRYLELVINPAYVTSSLLANQRHSFRLSRVSTPFLQFRLPGKVERHKKKNLELLVGWAQLAGLD